MADVGSGFWLTPAIALVTALVTPILAAFLPRLWQDDLQRLRSVSETRVKRLEALEKALSVTATAKAAGLGIDVTIHDLQRELQQIVHEFAGPAILSREELEKWISNPLLERLRARPNFTDPAEIARRYRYIVVMSRISIACYFLYFPLLIIIQKLYPDFFLKGIEKLAHMYSISSVASILIVGVLIPLYFIILPFVGVFGRYRTAKRALIKLRAMPESEVGEKKDSLATQPLADTKVCLKD
jgi:hypothetical protein